MPVIMVPSIDFDSIKGYFIDLQRLLDIFPNIESNKEMEMYVIEVRNEQDKLVKRFKPFKILKLKTYQYWDATYKKYIKYLSIPEDIALNFNIGKNYKIIIIITKYDGKPFLPFEIKSIGYNVEKTLEFFSRIEKDLLLLFFEQKELNEASSYLWDANSRLSEGDIEGARVSIRNSLEILEKFISNLIVPKEAEEIEEFPNRMKRLIKGIKDLIHYGGPHPGPAPRTTTEMVLSLTIDILRYLAQAIENKIITIKGGKET